MIFSLLCTIALFAPPAGWQEAKKPPANLLSAFIDPKGKEFPSRVTLAVEEDVDGTLQEYVKAVKALQMEDPEVKGWRDLGAIAMKGGEGRLIEMNSPSQVGEVKILQAFLLKDKTVHILTASCLKKEFGQFQKPFYDTFRSLNIAEN
jgi:hypothetical protein